MKIQANKILIVDDNSDFRKLLSVFLANIFENVKIVQHDPIALPELDVAINWAEYDLLLLDYNLGQEKTGLDWYQDLKTIDNFPTTVMLTGEGSEQLAVTAIKNGIDDYLSKENLTKSKLAKTIYEASQTHQEKIKTRLSLTYQGRAFSKALFYSTLDAAINQKNKNSRLIIIKCNSNLKNEEGIGIIYQDNLISFVSEIIYNFLLNLKLDIKIISMQDKYIALLIINDSHEIAYLPEKICQHMEKRSFTEGEISNEVFINLGVVPLTLDSTDSGKLLMTAINLCESLIVSNENAYVIYEKESSLDICIDENSKNNQLIEAENIEFNVMAAIQENRLQPLYQPMMAVTNIPNMIDRNAYVVRSRFISSSGVQISAFEHSQLMIIDKNILLVDNWVLRNSLGILLQSHKNTNDGLIFSMKLRNESIAGPHFVEWLIKLLKKETIPKHSFIFEITSDDLLKSAKKYSGLMTYLRQTYGFEFILSGLNSLSEYNRLSKNFCFEFYRFNKTFIDAINSPEPASEEWQELIRKIHDSGSYIIASFIEDATTLTNAIAIGIDIVQGYFVGEPTSNVPHLNRISNNNDAIHSEIELK